MAYWILRHALVRERLRVFMYYTSATTSIVIGMTGISSYKSPSRNIVFILLNPNSFDVDTIIPSVLLQTYMYTILYGYRVSK
ncbi:hypothetical protein J4526_07350 [Desulfurococcaceae archaeon MEX13E-LK6-19]|nr:hypothetical protein J4526_07350 [Desulfurococcaceae archaeon MEX13E-LK6-19]